MPLTAPGFADLLGKLFVRIETLLKLKEVRLKIAANFPPLSPSTLLLYLVFHVLLFVPKFLRGK